MISLLFNVFNPTKSLNMSDKEAINESSVREPARTNDQAPDEGRLAEPAGADRAVQDHRLLFESCGHFLAFSVVSVPDGIAENEAPLLRNIRQY